MARGKKNRRGPQPSVPVPAAEDPVESAFLAGAAAERDRLAALEELAAGRFQADVLQQAKADLSVTPERFAVMLLNAERALHAQALHTIQMDEQDLDAPAAAASPDFDSGAPAGTANPANVSRILNAGKRRAARR
jgi:hypothetical protein